MRGLIGERSEPSVEVDGKLHMPRVDVLLCVVRFIGEVFPHMPVCGINMSGIYRIFIIRDARKILRTRLKIGNGRLGKALEVIVLMEEHWIHTRPTRSIAVSSWQ